MVTPLRTEASPNAQRELCSGSLRRAPPRAPELQTVMQVLTCIILSIFVFVFSGSRPWSVSSGG